MNPLMMLAALQNTNPPNLWPFGVGSAVGLFAIALVVLYLVRRHFQGARNAHKEEESQAPRTENPSAFMAASMQGVIQKLRDQEKELERLHLIEKERGGHSGRRAGGALGEGSELTRLMAQSLAEGKIFRREQVEHVAPGGERRRLGVTISPIRRGNEKISGVLCLLSDLTELAALQQQMQLKENLAALGELSAGIAHEFKNALATISGYAQMILAEELPGEASDYANSILEQTRSITHVVTEFLKYVRPLDIGSEPVALDAVVERVVTEIAAAQPEVTVRAEGSFGSVAGDEGLLRQALLNLVRNAAEACDSVEGDGN